MNPEVIEEVMPFSEVFIAVFFLALEDLDGAFRLRILKGKDLKVLGARHMLLYLH